MELCLFSKHVPRDSEWMDMMDSALIFFQNDVLGISTARSLLQPAKFENIFFLKMACDMEKLSFEYDPQSVCLINLCVILPYMIYVRAINIVACSCMSHEVYF